MQYMKKKQLFPIQEKHALQKESDYRNVELSYIYKYV